MDQIIQSIQNIFGVSQDYAFMVVGLIVGLSLGLIVRRNQPVGNNPDRASVRSANIPQQSLINKNFLNTEKFKSSMTISEQKFDIDQAKFSQLCSLLRSGQKIEAIKLFREVTGIGLAEAKSVVESIENSLKQ